MPGRLQGKVVLVTGGSRGIGRAICLLLASEGGAVIVNYAEHDRAAAAVVDQIRSHEGRAIAFRADVSEPVAVRSMVEAGIREYGRIDVLVNNAGVLYRGTTLSLDGAELDRMLAVNVKGIVHCVQAVVPGMIERRFGKIINISSLAGLGTAIADTTPYALTKAAVVILTKRLAFELGPHRINVNAICPGYIRTEMLTSLENADDETRLQALSSKAMLGRVGEPDDIAGPVLFLAGQESSFMTGQVISVDGGRTDFLSSSR